MIYYNTENRKKFTKAIVNEARSLGVRLVDYDLDRSNIYYTDGYKTLDSLIERVVEDIRLWFSSDNLNKKEMCIAICAEPWAGESVRIQTRRKR